MSRWREFGVELVPIPLCSHLSMTNGDLSSRTHPPAGPHFALLTHDFIDRDHGCGGLSARSVRTRLTRGQLSYLAESYAGALFHRGLGVGDTLGVAIRPGGRSLAVLLAARKLGLRVAALDPVGRTGRAAGQDRVAAPTLVLADAAAQAVASWAQPLARRAQLELPALDSFGPSIPACTSPRSSSRSQSRDPGRRPGHRSR